MQRCIHVQKTFVGFTSRIFDVLVFICNRSFIVLEASATLVVKFICV